MGVPGDDHPGVALRLPHKLRLQAPDETADGRALLPHPEAFVECDLVVAAPPGVKLSPRGADLPDEAGLDGHVNIFSFEPAFAPGREAARFDLTADLKERPRD